MKLGFIGAGNMGSAMIGGILKSGLITSKDIRAVARSQETLDRIGSQYGIGTSLDAREVVDFADIIILAVKPYQLAGLLKELVGLLDGKILVSVAAGLTMDHLEEMVGSDKKIIRAMPNTPAMVGQAMSALVKNDQITDDDLVEVDKIFKCIGKTQLIDESMMDAVIGVSGSSPAYVFMFIEAMTDAAVLSGMPRDQAYQFAAQAVYGSAKMVMETGLHPGVLKDMVCSPGGTTIRAVEVLEENGLRNAVIKGQLACVKRSREMSQER